MKRGGERDLDAELVRSMRLALADAFDLGRVQGIDFSPALMLTLLAHGKGERQGLGENRAQRIIVARLANEVAADPAKIGADRPQRPIGALELFGVSVALMGDQRMLADPLIGLAQGNAGLLRQPDQTLPRPVHEPGVGRERHRLRLHRRVDDDARKVRGLGRAGSRRGRKALPDQRDELLLAHPLAPARQ